MRAADRVAALRHRAPLRAAAESVASGAGLQLIIAVSGVVSARLLGVDDRGRLALLWILTTVSAQLVTLGLHAAVSHSIAAGEPADAVIHRVRRRIVAQLIAAPLLAAAAIALVGGGSEYTLFAGGAMLPAAPAFVLILYGLAIVQGEQRYRSVQLNRLLQPVLYAVLLVGIAIAGGGDLVSISAIWASTMVFAGLLAWRRALGAWLPRARLAETESPDELARFGRRSFFGAFGSTEHLMLDQLVISVLLSPRGFGLYVAANAFANLPRFLGQSIGFIAYPEVTAAGDRRMAKLGRFVALGAALTAPLVIALIAIIGWLLPFLFGAAFADAVPVARILLVAAFFQSVRRVATEASRGLGGESAGSVAELTSVAVLVIAAVPLASLEGEQGAAVAVALAALAGCVALALALARVPDEAHATTGRRR